MNYVNGCHDGNGENTPGNVFSNLMSVDYQLKGSFDAVENTLLLINFHNLDEVNMKISEALKHNTYFKKRLNNIQTKTKTLKNKKKQAKLEGKNVIILIIWIKLNHLIDY